MTLFMEIFGVLLVVAGVGFMLGLALGFMARSS